MPTLAPTKASPSPMATARRGFRQDRDDAICTLPGASAPDRPVGLAIGPARLTGDRGDGRRAGETPHLSCPKSFGGAYGARGPSACPLRDLLVQRRTAARVRSDSE